MLVSLTRVGATRQGMDKAFAVLGAEQSVMVEAFSRIDTEVDDVRLNVVPVAGSPGLFALRLPPLWLGTRSARDDVFTRLADTMRELCEAAARNGGVLVPAGVAVGGRPAVLGGDLHMFEVLSPVEQEVLCNLLRSWVPALIAVAGQGFTASDRPHDRVGSRWLATSNSHLAARFLASTAREHLQRVKAELRRQDGVARLDRMDIAPGVRPDGTSVVVIRCLDGAASLAGARAHALLLSALALHARRLVRDGRRLGNAPQRLLEENRARAVAEGLRARFSVDVRRKAPGGGHSRDRQAARDAVRELLAELAVEFRNLEASAEEIAPLLVAVDLPALGVRDHSTERALLAHWASQGDEKLLAGCHQALGDAKPGGPLLSYLSESCPGRTSVVLGTWRDRIEEAANPSPRGRSPRRDREREQRGAGRPRHSGGEA